MNYPSQNQGVLGDKSSPQQTSENANPARNAYAQLFGHPVDPFPLDIKDVIGTTGQAAWANCGKGATSAHDGSENARSRERRAFANLWSELRKTLVRGEGTLGNPVKLPLQALQTLTWLHSIASARPGESFAENYLCEVCDALCLIPLEKLAETFCLMEDVRDCLATGEVRPLPDAEAQLNRLRMVAYLTTQ